MKLIIGIGNPGEKYKKTRHNAGIMFIKHQIARNNKQDTNKIKYLVSNEFMNSSGVFVKEQVEYFNVVIDDVYVAHDDLDLKLGEFKIQKGVGPKVHNGINSVNHALGNANYWRIRIGVDNRNTLNRIPGEAYVLENFLDSEVQVLEKVFEEILQNLN